MNLLL